MARKLLSSAACLLWLLLVACQSVKPHEGDLLFHIAAQPNHITTVTPAMIDHVAIALGRDSVIEAVPRRGVVISPLDELRRQEGYYVLSRVAAADKRQSTLNARQFLGCRYDSLYLPANSAIYCSELVLQSYVDKKGDTLFRSVPMSFHDGSGNITAYWREFYARHGMAVPEGWPGSNPAELSRRDAVRIVGRLK